MQLNLIQSIILIYVIFMSGLITLRGMRLHCMSMRSGTNSKLTNSRVNYLAKSKVFFFFFLCNTYRDGRGKVRCLPIYHPRNAILKTNYKSGTLCNKAD